MASPERRRESEELLRDLASPDAELRRLGVERAGALPDEQGMTLLMDRLGDESWRVRKAAVQHLAAAGARAPVRRALIEALRDGENAGRRNAALDALIGCGATALPALVEAARDADPDVRKPVIDALAVIGDARAADCVLAALEDADPNVRAAAADALGAIAAADAGEALLRRLATDAQTLVRLSCLRALLRLEAPVPCAAIEPLLRDGALRAAAIELLGQSGERDADECLLAHLAAPAPSVRDAAASALRRRIGTLAAGPAAELAARIRGALDASEVARGRAFERLLGAPLPRRIAWIELAGRVGWESAVLPLLDAARDEAVAAVALGALRALGAIGEKRLVEAWPRLDEEARALACAALADGSSPEGLALLAAALDAGDPTLRLAGIEALGERGEPALLPPLVERAEACATQPLAGDDELAAIGAAVSKLVASAGTAGADRERALVELDRGLGSNSEPVRAAFARVLTSLGLADVTRTAALLADPSPRVRRAAVETLGALQAPGVETRLAAAAADADASVRSAVALALALRRGDAADATVAALAEDGDARVRASAARAAVSGARAEDSEDAGRLARALRDEAPVALAALEGLVERGGPLAAPLALPLLDHADEEVVLLAARCVGRHGAPDALVPLLTHPAWPVRAEAVVWLGERGSARNARALLGRLELEQDGFVRDALLHALRRFEDER